MQQQAHIAYAVPNIEEAIKDTKLLFGPFDMGHMLLAFVAEEGVAIEFNEFKSEFSYTKDERV